LLISLLCGATVESAQARISFSSSGRGGSSASFKSGFSSHKASSVSQDAVQSSAKNTSFGSFGAAAGAAQPKSAAAPSNSALSKDLNTTAANSNALKTFDARNQAAAPSPTATVNPATGGQIGYAAPPIYAHGVVPQTIVVQRDNGFSASPFLWFMVGRSMGNHDGDRVVYERPVYPANGAVGNPDGINSAPDARSWEPQESFGAKFLRVMLWLMIIAMLVGLASYLINRRAARSVMNKSHYSLGKN